MPVSLWDLYRTQRTAAVSYHSSGGIPAVPSESEAAPSSGVAPSSEVDPSPAEVPSEVAPSVVDNWEGFCMPSCDIRDFGIRDFQIHHTRDFASDFRLTR